MSPNAEIAAPQLYRWPFRLAVALAIVTFPLIWVGGLVTSYDAGMAVPDWPTTFGYNMFLYPWQSWFFGPWDLFVEHGHRLLGSLAGLLAIALVLVTWRSKVPRLLAAAAVGLLLLVLLQGVLGGLRVRMNSRPLAQVHGVVGPLFFAAVVCFAVWTGRRARRAAPRLPAERLTAVQGTTLWLGGLLLLQLLLGSQLRHVDGLMSGEVFRWSALFHVGLALVLLAGSGRLVWSTRGTHGPVRRLACLGLGLFLVQVALGAITWMQRYGWPQGLFPISPLPAWVVQSEGLWQSMSATAHVAVGALILAVQTALAVVCHTPQRWASWTRGEALA